MHPSALAQFYTHAWVRRDLTRQCVPSGHRYVEIAKRARATSTSIMIKLHIMQHHRFKVVVLEEMCIHHIVRDSTTRYEANAPAAHGPQRRVIPLAFTGADPPPQALAGACLALPQMVRNGLPHDVATTAKDIPQRAHVVDGSGVVRIPMVFTALQTHLDAATMYANSELDRNNVHDIHNILQHWDLRPRVEPYRSQRNRLTLSVLYDHSGAASTGEHDASGLTEISDTWTQKTPITCLILSWAVPGQLS